LTIQNGAERVEPDAGYMGWLLYRK
jgi:hypothetical protein